MTLSHPGASRAQVLSGGQRKLELARILMADRQGGCRRRAGGDDPALLETVIDRVLELQRQGKSILLIERNMRDGRQAPATAASW